MLGEYLHFVTVQKVEWKYKGGGQVPGYPGYPARCFCVWKSAAYSGKI